MTVLHWDLREDATRNQLLAQTQAAIGDDRALIVHAAADAAGVPDKRHHDLSEVNSTIDSLKVDEEVKRHLRAIYRILAEAESVAHGCSVEDAHFHEVGNGSGIRNVVEICLAIQEASPERITASSAQVGEGVVLCAHGELAIPAPATAAIIARGIPVCDTRLAGERMTPTSAAVVLHYVDEFK